MNTRKIYYNNNIYTNYFNINDYKDEDFLPSDLLKICNTVKEYYYDNKEKLNIIDICDIYKDHEEDNPLSQYSLNLLFECINKKTFKLLDVSVQLFILSNIDKRMSAFKEANKKAEDNIKIQKMLKDQINDLKNINSNTLLREED